MVKFVINCYKLAKLFIFTILKKYLYIFLIFIALQQTASAQISLDQFGATAEQKYINTYPNPASDVVNFKFQKGNSRSYSIQILNSIGKRMYQAKSLPPFFSIDLKQLRFYRGIYIYQLIDRNGIVIESSKILVVN